MPVEIWRFAAHAGAMRALDGRFTGDLRVLFGRWTDDGRAMFERWIGAGLSMSSPGTEIMGVI